MYTDRLTLPSGRWVDITTRVSFGVRRAVQLALLHYRLPAGVDPEIKLRAAGEIIVAMATAWDLASVADGQTLPITLDGIDEVDAADVDRIFHRCVELYEAGTATDPK